jgi:hypothetical protein
MNHSPVFELHVQPTYAVCVPQRLPSNYLRTEKQIQNEQNLKENKRKDQLSRKAIRRLTNSVNWLVASAKQKWVFDKQTKKRFNFKVNFITLTLPTLDHGVTDNQFKKDLLHNFINTCRVAYGLKNYVWKVEAQENGNIHAHFTTDTFIHWKDVRNVWNRILIKKGIIQAYHDKHINLSFDEYCLLYDPTGTKDIQSLKRAFQHGQSTNWQDPNSTDVHAVHKVKDVAAYLAKYMSKKEDDRRNISGRLWGCSYNLSESNKLVIEVQGHEDTEIISELFKPEIEYKEITAISALSKLPFRVGEIFFYKISDWGKVLKGKLLEKYNEHRFNIRHNINITRDIINEKVVENIVPVFQLEKPIFETLSSNQLNFNI